MHATNNRSPILLRSDAICIGVSNYVSPTQFAGVSPSQFTWKSKRHHLREEKVPLYWSTPVQRSDENYANGLIRWWCPGGGGVWGEKSPRSSLGPGDWFEAMTLSWWLKFEKGTENKFEPIESKARGPWACKGFSGEQKNMETQCRIQ